MFSIRNLMALANVQTFARDKLTIIAAALQQINKVAHQAPQTEFSQIDI
jgi:hypothetical protein